MLGSVNTAEGGGASRPLGGTGLVSFPLALDGSIFGWASGPEETSAVLDAFSAAGGRLVATADHYAGGRSEVMLGAWMRDRGHRDGMLVATRVGRHPDAAGLSPNAIARGVEASLRRLGTDRIDFLTFDGDHPETPFEDSLEAIDRLRREGKVRFLSVAGFAADRIVELTDTANRFGLPAPSGVVTEYNLLQRAPFEQELAPVAARAGLAVFARLPLASGYLAGVLRSRDQVPTSVMYAAAREHIGGRGERILAAVERIAAELGTSLAAVSLAWLLGKPAGVFPVVRAASADQVDGLLAAAELRLSRQQMALLDRASE
jgi:aryl-alcohol dehydrogenase-like predicted oxidoreductase